MSANKRGKNAKNALRGKEKCPLIRGCANYTARELESFL